MLMSSLRFSSAHPSPAQVLVRRGPQALVFLAVRWKDLGRRLGA